MSTPVYRNKLPSLIWTVLLGSLLFSAVSCSGGSSGQAPGRGGQVQAYPVLKLHPRSVTLTTSYPANLRGYQTVEIRPRVQGYIEEMLVDEGARVHKGETLFRLNNQEYQQQVRSAKADVEAAKAAVSSAEDEVERLKPLVEKDIISNYRLQSAKNDLQSKKAAQQQAEASLENAQVNLSYSYVKSPANGVIGNIPYRVGSLVSSSITKPLTTVSDISKVYAYFSMSERELLDMTRATADPGGNTNLHQRVEDMPKANLILSDGTVYDHEGDVALASGLIEEGTGSASFRALFPNPQQILRSGASANVQIPFHQDSAILVPKKATYEIQNKTFVYTVSDSNSVESMPIEVRPLSTQKLYVASEGLSSGDTIVMAGMGGLKDGAKIKPQPMNSDSLYEALTVQDQAADSTSTEE